jgi:hypothetical protein
MHYFLLCVFILLLSVACDTAIGAPSAAPVTVVFVTMDGKPAAGARVIDARSLRLLGTTNKDGALTITVPAGTLISAQRGTDVAQQIRVPVDGGSVHLSLLKFIVQVNSKPTGGSAYGSEAAASLALGGPGNAARAVPNYRSLAEGGGGSVAVDGIDLPPFAQTGQYITLPVDLFENVTATSPDNGQVDLDYGLLHPTPSFATSAELSAQTYEGERWKGGASGMSGQLGYAFAAAGSDNAGPLYNYIGFDSSGESYNHSAASLNRSASLDLEHKTRSSFLQLAGFGTTGSANDINQQIPGRLLTGIGPGNYHHSESYGLWSFFRNTNGRDAVTALISTFGGGYFDNATDAEMFGVPTPNTAGVSYTGQTEKLEDYRQFFNSGIDLAFSSTTQHVVNSYDASSSRSYAAEQQFGGSYDLERGSWKLKFGTTYHLQHGFQDGTGFDTSGSLSRTDSKGSVGVAVYNGSAQKLVVAEAAAAALGPINQDTITCDPLAAIVPVQSEQESFNPTTTSFSVHALRTNSTWSFGAGGFASDTPNAVVNFIAPSAGYTLPVGYFAALSAYARNLCAAKNDLLLLTQQYRTVTSLRQLESYASAKFQHRNLTVQGFVEYLRAAVDCETTSLPTYPACGGQVPEVPPLRANLLLALASQNGTVALDLASEGRNNSNNLPGYTTLNLGLYKPFGKSFLRVSIQNVLNADTSQFYSPFLGVPITIGNVVIPTLARSLERTWSATYGVRM